jgi:hypothetical protein
MTPRSYQVEGHHILIRWMHPNWRWDLYTPNNRWVASDNAVDPDGALAAALHMLANQLEEAA